VGFFVTYIVSPAQIEEFKEKIFIIRETIGMSPQGLDLIVKAVNHAGRYPV